MAMQLSGSLVISGSIIASAGITGSFSGSATSASYADTLGGLPSSSFAPAATFNTVSQSFATTSGSIAGRMTIVEGQDATTGSNTFTGTQYVSEASNAISFTSTASLYTDGGLRVAKDSFVSGTAYFNNITVYGTSSIEYITSSQVNIGSNVITVNTDTPAIRFGGISVFDSGSTQLTGSLFWDSEKNHWIYSNPSSSSYNSAMLMNGPRNTGSLGDEQGTTNNALMKGQGGDHITSSQMIDDGTTVRIPGALQVTGSTILASTLTGTNATFSDSSTLLTLSSGAGTKAVFATTRNFGVNRNFQIAVDEFAESAFTITPSTTLGGSSYTTPIFTLAAAGTATFSSSVTAATLIFKDAINSNSYGFRGLSGIVTLDAGSVYPTGWNFQYGGGASSALYINGSGNVGIGINNPAYPLDLGTGGTGNQIRARRIYASGTGITSGFTLDTTLMYVSSSGEFNITNPGSYPNVAFTINNSGNVGIGTNNPTRQLFVNSTAFFDNNGDGSTTNPSIAIGSTSVGISYIGGGNLAFLTGATERMRITSGGTVGIGVIPSAWYNTDGYAALQVGNASLFGRNSTNSELYLSSNAYDNTSGNPTYITDTFATRYVMNTGIHRWLSAPSGAGGGAITFTESMRITSGGELLWNLTAATGAGLSGGGVAFRNNAQKYMQISTGYTTDATLIYFYKNDGAGGVTNTGTISTSGNSTLYNTTSDYRLKEDLKEIKGLEKVSALKVYDFKWKGTEQRMDGVLAHELQEVLPYAVYGEKDAEEMQSVDYSKLVPILVKAIQELEARVKELENK